MKEIHDRLWQKYMDKAIEHLDRKSLEMLQSLPPSMASLMLIKMGKEMCEQEEFDKIIKPLKKKWWEFWK